MTELMLWLEDPLVCAPHARLHQRAARSQRRGFSGKVVKSGDRKRQHSRGHGARHGVYGLTCWK